MHHSPSWCIDGLTRQDPDGLAQAGSSLRHVIHLTFGTNLEGLAEPLAAFHFNGPGDELESLWTVVPTMAFRQWLDQAVASSATESDVAIAANLVAIFPMDLAIRIEQLALGDDWMEWGTETTALRLLSALDLDTFAQALTLAQAFDDVVHWRPHLLQDSNRSSLPPELLAAMEAIDFFERGPHVQRRVVLEKIRAGEVEGLPTQLAVFGLSTVPGGRRFLELLQALGTQLRVAAFLPIPSTQWLANLRQAPGVLVEEKQASFSWFRDLAESTLQWLEFGQVDAVIDSSTPPISSLDRLRLKILNESVDGVPETSAERSVRFLGGFGRSRQVEQLRDALLELIASGVAPHEILVVCPDPPAFQAALERHWNYQSWQGEQGPRLPFELLEVAPNGLRNRLLASIALLQLIGNYATVAQVVSLLSYPSVAATLGLSGEDIETLSRRADEGKLIFGVSAEQRARFGVYPSGPQGDFQFDIGTWSRVSDAIVSTTLFPPEALEVDGDEALKVRSLGEPHDLSVFGAVQPLFRLLEAEDHLRPGGVSGAGVKRSLPDWLDSLNRWMSTLAKRHDSDDSFERMLDRMRRACVVLDGAGGAELGFEQFVEFWTTVSGQGNGTRVFGRRGVLVAGLEALSWVPHRVVAILGLDEELLPQAMLSSQVMAHVEPDLKTGPASQLGDPDPRRTAMGELLGAVFAARETLLVSWNVTDETTGQPLDPPIALSELLEVAVSAKSVPEVHGETVEALLHEQFRHARRHGFSGGHQHPRYDIRLRELQQPPDPLPEAPLQPAPQSAGIDDLRSFFRDPVGFHLRNARNLSIPRSLEVPPVRPALSVDGLTKYRLREAFTEAALQLPSWSTILDQVSGEDSYQAAFASWQEETHELFARLSKSEEFAGDVPSRLWLEDDLKTKLDLFTFNLAFDVAEYSLLARSMHEVQPRLLLSGGGSLLLAGNVAPLRPDLLSGIVESTATSEVHLLRYRASVATDAASHSGRIVGDLLDLLTLEALFPDRICAITTFHLPDRTTAVKRVSGGGFVPVGAYVLNPTMQVRRAKALAGERTPIGQLDVLWSLFTLGFEHPLALFRKTSEAAAFENFSASEHLEPKELWIPSTPRVLGEASTVVHQLLFPLTFEELCAETSFTALAESLKKAAQGVAYSFASQTNRPASAALGQRHSGFVTSSSPAQGTLLVKDDS